MEFGVLGALHAVRGDAVVAIGGGQQRRLLAALLVHADTVVSTDRLVEALWGEDPPPTARATLWTYIARLRRILNPPGTGDAEALLVTRPPGYVLRAGPEQVDAGRFERLVNDARRVRASRPLEALAGLDEALALWRGPAYAEFADAEFARSEASRLEELRVAAIEERFDTKLVLGRHPEVVGEIEAFVAGYPLRERLRAQLMLALYRCGRQAEALRAYGAYREMLVGELGIDPSAALQALEGDILRQHPGLDWTAPPEERAQAKGPAGGRDELLGAGNLPVELTSFVGREGDVAEVLAALDACRLVTLIGVGGVGKTRLALQVARAAGSRYRNGVRWCELAPLAESSAVAHAVAAAVGAQRDQNRSIDESLVAFLASKSLLLVVDNCEHVLDGAAPLVDAVVRGCPNVTVLATSRTRLGATAEHIRPITPLAVPEPDAGPAVVVESPAVALFVDRGRAVRPDLDLSAGNLDTIGELCRRLDGLPLAIELAAARLRSLNPADLAGRIGDRFELLASSPHIGAVARHHTLRALIDWSYGLLGEPQQQLFDRLSVFAGGFTLAAAEQVCAGNGIATHEVVDLLATLVDSSMVNAGPTAGNVRYSLLETLRQYGRDRLDERDTLDPLRAAHAAYYVTLVQQADVGLRGPHEAAWVTVVDRELDNLRTANQWAMERGDPDLALPLSTGLRHYVLERFNDEVVSWAESAIGLPDADTHPLFPQVCGLVGQGLALRGQLERGLAAAERGLARAHDPDDPRRVYGLKAVTIAALFQGRLHDCFRGGADIVDLARRHNDTYHADAALRMQSLARTYGGDAVAGLAIAREEDAVAHAVGNPTMLAWAQYTQAEALSILDPERARGAYERAAGIAESVGATYCAAIASVSLAALLGRSGAPADALRSFAEIIERWHRMGIWTQQWTSLRHLVLLFVRIGAPEPAAVLLGAIRAADTATDAYGDDARHLTDAARQLEETLGAESCASATTRGSSMSGDDAVDFARCEIDHARAAHA